MKHEQALSGYVPREDTLAEQVDSAALGESAGRVLIVTMKTNEDGSAQAVCERSSEKEGT